MLEPTPRRALACAALALLVPLALACKTVGGGRSVDDANQAVVESIVRVAVSELSPSGASDPDGRLAAAIERIDTYIAAHPGEIRIVNALLVRKGHLLIATGERNRGLATLNQVDPRQLSNTRDLALYRLRNQFHWWYGIIGTAPGGNFQADAADAREEIQRVVDDLFPADGERPGMFYYLHEWRALIAVRMAEQTGAPDRAREILAEGLTEYGASFDTQDQEGIPKQCRGEHAGSDAAMLRWSSGVRTVLREANRTWSKQIVGHGEALPFPAWGADCSPSS